MEMKAFKLEDSSSEVSEKVAESNSTGVSQRNSKVLCLPSTIAAKSRSVSRRVFEGL